MSWTPTDEQVEKAARALARTDGPGAQAYIDARAVLVAVGPMIAASALRDAAASVEEIDGRRDDAAAAWLNRRADAIEKEAGR